MISKPPLRQVTGLTSALFLTATSSLACVSLAHAADAQNVYRSPSTFYDALSLQARPDATVWARLRSEFRLPHDADNPRVQRWISWYQAHPQFFMQTADQARPWLRFIAHQVEAHDMPAEIALLPFVESAYNPTAHNAGGSTGLWQFMPATGDAMGLERTWWYDGRKDVVAATQAALTYLRMQATQWYDGNWELALAAYNAGAGTVNRARQVAANRGDPIDYWHLALPEETMNYVPRLLALATIVAQPRRYGITLPNISDAPAFVQVKTGGQIDLKLAAKLANTSEQQLRSLNPAYRRWATRPRNNPPLLIPVEKKQAFLANLAELPASQRSSWQRYVVRRGDTLSGLAARTGTPMRQIRRKNALRGSTLRIGQTLLLPAQSAQALASRESGSSRKRHINVKPGENLWTIAKRHKVAIKDLARWNNIGTDQYLQPGQRLTLYRAD